MKEHIIIPIFIPHQGCAYHCVYCNQKAVTAASGPPGPEEVASMVECQILRLPAGSLPEVAFYGGSFTGLNFTRQEKYLEAVRPFLDSGRIYGIRVSTSPDAVDSEVLNLLLSYGVKTVELGVQSLDEEVLKLSGRCYGPGEVEQASNLIRKMGMVLGHQLMVGLPGSTPEKEIETAHRSVSMRPQIARIYPTVVLKGTVLADMTARGEYHPLDLENAVNTAALLLTILEKAGIKVIRIGLHPGPELLSGNQVVGGPFHPGFGEMAKSRVFRWQACSVIQRFLKTGRQTGIRLFVNGRDLSKMTGYRRSNLRWLELTFGLESVTVRAMEGTERNWVGAGRPNDDRPGLVVTRHDFYQIHEECYQESKSR